MGDRYPAINSAGNQSRQKYEAFSGREKTEALPGKPLYERFRQVVACHHQKAKENR
jgi:hypothetical protein